MYENNLNNIPLISIAMATYNGEKYILEQLESFVNQTIPPNELVITDDCSTDNTLKIIYKFKKDAPFDVRVYLNEKNLGYTQNFNRAMQLCKNEIIFLSDQDDIWFPEKIAHILYLAKKFNDKDVFMVNAETVTENLKRTGLTQQGQLKNAGKNEESFVLGCCIAVRKTFLDKILPISDMYNQGHDNWIIDIADMLNLRIIDPKVLQLYRRHESNTSSSLSNKVKKVNLLDILKKNLYLVFKSDDQKYIEEYILRDKVLLLKIKELLKSFQLQNEIVLLTKKIFLLEERLRIVKSRNIIIRISLGLKFYMQGKYKAFSGYKSLLRDIVIK